VDAGATNQTVGAAAAIEIIGAHPAAEQIRAAIAAENVLSVCPIENIRSSRTEEHYTSDRHRRVLVCSHVHGGAMQTMQAAGIRVRYAAGRAGEALIDDRRIRVQAKIAGVEIDVARIDLQIAEPARLAIQEVLRSVGKKVIEASAKCERPRGA